jgi:hypothetical protein
MITTHGASGTTRPMARAQLMRKFATFTGRLVELRDWLVAAGVTQMAMEATGVSGGRSGMCSKKPTSSCCLLARRISRMCRAVRRREGLRVAGPAAGVWACCGVVHPTRGVPAVVGRRAGEPHTIRRRRGSSVTRGLADRPSRVMHKRPSRASIGGCSSLGTNPSAGGRSDVAFEAQTRRPARHHTDGRRRPSR